MNRITSQDAAHPSSLIENPAYLREQLITCIGNKRALLGEIGVVIDQVRGALGREKLRFVDLFAGSGVVSRRARQACHHIVANDLEPYSAAVNACYLADPSAETMAEVEQHLVRIQRRVRENPVPGFIAALYAPSDDLNVKPGERAFYTRRNAIYLDAACQAIADMPTALQPFLRAPLIAAASVHTNTAGVFKGFYKNKAGVGQFGGEGRFALSRITGNIELSMPVLSWNACQSTVTRRDANDLVHDLEPMDLAYIDPPYNQHPYGSNYFMLNLIAEYREPRQISRVSGIPIDWNRSPYNKARIAEDALLELVEACRAPFVLLSYNSEGFVEKEQLTARLSGLGRLSVTALPYNTFRGSRNLRARSRYVTEYLFLLDRR